MIKVDHELCIGCGACVAICPSHFVMNDQGKSDVIDQTPADCVPEAIAGCPVTAISQD
jgi:ferredoxin